MGLAHPQARARRAARPPAFHFRARWAAARRRSQGSVRAHLHHRERRQRDRGKDPSRLSGRKRANLRYAHDPEKWIPVFGQDHARTNLTLRNATQRNTTQRKRTSMPIKVGDRLPNATFRVMTAESPKPKTTDDIFKGKSVQSIAVTGVNDVFVMEAWKKATGATGKIDFLADGNGEFAKAIDMA